tara:strand:+ start:40031 stop:40381 length:351 start_codon:yes stop_codon:yes gene_type:complete
MACEQMKKTREGLLKTLEGFRKKRAGRRMGGVKKSYKDSDLSNDIKLVISKLEQIDRDIKECMDKEKEGKKKQDKQKKSKPAPPEKKKITVPQLKPINPTLLDSSVTEKSHGTGNR